MAMSVLKKNVSMFANYYSVRDPVTVSLMQWLKCTRYEEQVQEIHSISDKAERDRRKATLPAITPSGVFSYRSEALLVEHSGLIQFDVDFKDNRNIKNFDNLKDQLCNIPNVAYCGLSVSGRGYWGLVPIKDPAQHKSHFEALQKLFKERGLIIDPAPQNPASNRGYSIDPDAYFNHNAIPFTLLGKPATKAFKKTHRGNDTTSIVEDLIRKIQSRDIDITVGYDRWLRIGFALADQFDESGLTYYHAVSKYYPGYSEQETDRQYTNCLQSSGHGITIATFIHYARKAL